MRKTVALFLLLCITLTAAACSTGQTTPRFAGRDANYDLVTQTYTNRKITINYPQLTRMSDSVKQDVINEIIKKEALYILDTLNRDHEIAMKIDYEVCWQGKELLSIIYHGARNIKGSVNATQEFYTTNINITRGTKLQLKDVVQLDRDFVNKVKAGRLLAVREGVSMNSLRLMDDKLLRNLQAADTAALECTTYSYFTERALGISLIVSYAAGDHVEIEIDYKDLLNHVKKEHEIWQNITHR